MRKLLFLSVAASLLAAAIWSFGHLGHWLVVEDPPAHAAAIFVLGGEAPIRAMEGARMYHQGWAPEVWLAPEGRRRYHLAFAKLGLEVPGERDVNRAALIQLGVPQSAIRILDAECWDTYDEVRTASNELSRRAGPKTLIIATSQVHTRRVRVLWNALARPDQRLIVRPARQDGFRGARWWNNTSDILSVSREVMGIFNIWLGFPVRTRRS